MIVIHAHALLAVAVAMEMARIIGIPAVLLLLAYIANRLSRLTRVPDIVVLLLTGVILGPILHWVKPNNFQGVVDVFGTLALILILFEGGLELRLRQALRYFPGALLLMLLSYGLTLGVIALVGHGLLHLAWDECLLLGAALGCTSGTIVIPALQQIASPDSVKITLTLEASMGEVIAVLLVGSALSTGGSQSLFTNMAVDFSHHVLVALLLGVAVGAVWSRLWPLVASQPDSNILNLGAVMGVYALARVGGGSGLLAVFIFGITMANLPRTPHAARQEERMLAFHSELSFLVRSFFFVLLGIVAEFISREYILAATAIVAGLLLARFLAVQASGWAVRDANRKDKELLFWMLPRGLVTAVLALQIVEARGEMFAFLPAMAFTVILVTNVFVVTGAVRAGTHAVIAEAAKEKSFVM